MPNKTKPTWIAVMDGAQARFFALRRSDDGQVFEETAPPLSAKPQARARGDKPGRAYSATGGGVRHAVVPRTDPRKLETALFAREVAGALDAALAGKRYDQLVLVAPSRNLAELREHLTARVREKLAHQVPKNLIKLGTDALWEKLSVVLLKAARPVMNGAAARVATISGNAMPVSMVFREMEPSRTVQSAALKYAAKLGRKFGRIMHCRVTVEAPHHAHRKVKMFRVSIELKLPGREIATKYSDTPAYSEIGTALREAFATATRQMQDHVRKTKGGTVRTRRQASPRTRGEVAAESES
jgi:protein required for attachment to host cells/ribosome-associated translation inhibitor RaiA